MFLNRLKLAPQISAKDFYILDTDFGLYIGDLAADFLRKHDVSVNLIGWHGHTIFHDPAAHATSQIGHGAAIAAQTGLPTVCQFRNMDMALGGQGAPLAPLADKFLLPPAAFYLNLGGISNVAFYDDLHHLRSFDVSPCNQLLNRLAEKKGMPFDEGGSLASHGNLDKSLFGKLNAIDYYQAPFPKSIDNNWITKIYWPILEQSDATIEDKLNTCVHHIAYQLARAFKIPRDMKNKKVIVTGGGAYNTFLINTLQHYIKDRAIEIKIPDPKIIEFKEAALMALMAFFFVKNQPNVLKEVTGSKIDHIGGCFFQGWKKPFVLH